MINILIFLYYLIMLLYSYIILYWDLNHYFHSVTKFVIRWTSSVRILLYNTNIFSKYCSIDRIVFCENLSSSEIRQFVQQQVKGRKFEMVEIVEGRIFFFFLKWFVCFEFLKEFVVIILHLFVLFILHEWKLMNECLFTNLQLWSLKLSSSLNEERRIFKSKLFNSILIKCLIANTNKQFQFLSIINALNCVNNKINILRSTRK